MLELLRPIRCRRLRLSDRWLWSCKYITKRTSEMLSQTFSATSQSLQIIRVGQLIMGKPPFGPMLHLYVLLKRNATRKTCMMEKKLLPVQNGSSNYENGHKTCKRKQLLMLPFYMSWSSSLIVNNTEWIFVGSASCFYRVSEKLFCVRFRFTYNVWASRK